MGEITKLTLVNLVSKIKSKEISALDACSDYVNRIVKSKKLNTFVTETLEQAISFAKKLTIIILKKVFCPELLLRLKICFVQKCRNNSF